MAGLVYHVCSWGVLSHLVTACWVASCMIMLHSWWFTLLWLSSQLLTCSVIHLSHFHFALALTCIVWTCFCLFLPWCETWLRVCHSSSVLCGLCPLLSMTDQFLHSRTRSFCLAAIHTLFPCLSAWYMTSLAAMLDDILQAFLFTTDVVSLP